MSQQCRHHSRYREQSGGRAKENRGVLCILQYDRPRRRPLEHVALQPNHNPFLQTSAQVTVDRSHRCLSPSYTHTSTHSSSVTCFQRTQPTPTKQQQRRTTKGRIRSSPFAISVRGTGSRACYTLPAIHQSFEKGGASNESL